MTVGRAEKQRETNQREKSRWTMYNKSTKKNISILWFQYVKTLVATIQYQYVELKSLYYCTTDMNMVWGMIRSSTSSVDFILCIFRYCMHTSNDVCSPSWVIYFNIWPGSSTTACYTWEDSERSLFSSSTRLDIISELSWVRVHMFDLFSRSFVQ